jgi:hypothetical protein
MRDFWKRFPLFPMMLFASVPGLTDAGGDAGGGDDGTIVVDEPPTDDTTDDSSGEGVAGEGDEDFSATDQSDIEGDSETQETEGAAPKPLTDKEVEQRLNKLKKVDPQLAALFRKDHFHLRDYRRAGTPSEVMEMRDTLETYGGAEGLEDLRGKADMFADELVQLSNGDTGIVDTLAQDYPQSLAKLAPHSMEKLRQINPQAYERSASGITANFMRDKGVTNSLVRLGDIIRAGGEHAQKDSFELVQKLVDWAQKTEEYGRSQPREEGESEAEKRLRMQQQKIEQDRSSIQTEKIGNAITTSMNQIIQKHLNPYLKDRKLTLDQKKHLATNIFTAISDSLKSNERYQARFKALRQRGDVREIARFVSSKVEEIAAKSVRGVWNASGHANVPRKPANTNGNARPGIVRSATIPAPHTVDWSKDPGRRRFLNGEVTLKKEFGGKTVRFDPNAL